MKKSLLALTALLLLTGVGCVAQDNKNQQTPPPQTQTTPTPSKPEPKPEPEPVFCTMDAKQCPDGSYVGRTGPKCEFTACPETSS